MSTRRFRPLSWRPNLGRRDSTRRLIMSLIGVMFMVVALVIGLAVALFVYRTEAETWRARQS